MMLVIKLYWEIRVKRKRPIKTRTFHWHASKWNNFQIMIVYKTKWH